MKVNPSQYKGSDDLPVDSVSWFDAVTFCNKLSEQEKLDPYYQIDGESVTIRDGKGYRLPTEAEWEYACRAGSTTIFPWGDTLADMGDYAWFAVNSGGKPHPVGQKRPNPWGLLDLPGNIRDWCWDRYDPSGYGKSLAVDDPTGAGVEFGDRATRGLHWSQNDLRACESVDRWGRNPHERVFDLGFRVARTTNEPAAPAMIGILQKPPAQPATTQPPPTEVDRKAAEWVLSVGGKVSVIVGGQERFVPAAAQLPSELFRLTGIDLQDIKSVEDDSLAHLENVTLCRGISLWGTNITDEGLKHLENMVGLNSVGVFATRVTGTGFKYLRRATSLSNVGAWQANFTDEGLEVLKSFPALSGMYLFSNTFTDVGMSYIRDMKHLRSMNIFSDKLTNRGLEYLSEAPELEEIWTQKGPLTDAHGLVKLARLPKLKHLWTGGFPIDDDQFKELMTRAVRLEHLGLGESRITDKGLEAVRCRPELTMLGLGRSPLLTDQGMANLLQLPGLGFLGLPETAITDDGLKTLQKIATLKQLDVRGTKVTAAGVAEFQKALPNCKVEVSPEVQKGLESLHAKEAATNSPESQ